MKAALMIMLLVLASCANRDPTMSGVTTLQQVGADIATQDEKK